MITLNAMAWNLWPFAPENDATKRCLESGRLRLWLVVTGSLVAYYEQCSMSVVLLPSGRRTILIEHPVSQLLHAITESSLAVKC